MCAYDRRGSDPLVYAVTFYVDWVATIEGLRVGAILIGSNGFKNKHAFQFKFFIISNATEYEALILVLKLTVELKV